MVRAYFAGQSGGSGGGVNAPIIGVKIDINQSYDTAFSGLIKISDLTPTAEDITGGICAVLDGGFKGAYTLSAETEDGAVLVIVGDEGVGAYSLPPDVAAVFGTPSGFYASPMFVHAWFCWEPK